MTIIRISTDAYVRGVQDRRCFHAYLSNPYKRGSMEYWDWAHGWTSEDIKIDDPQFQRVP